jgi:hypothetical protein
MKKDSRLYKLSHADWLKGFYMTGGSAAATALIDMLSSGKLPDVQQLRVAGTTGLIAGLVYLLKNYLTNSQGQPLKKEQ